MASETLAGLKEWMEALETSANRLTYLRDQIKEEFDLPQLKDQLLTLPGQIKKTQIVALQKKAELTEAEQGMKQWEATVIYEINNELGANGKPKFSNEPARKAELIIRLTGSEEYINLKEQRSAIEFKVWESEAEVDKLRNDFRSRLAIKDLIVAELNLYTK